MKIWLEKKDLGCPETKFEQYNFLEGLFARTIRAIYQNICPQHMSLADIPIEPLEQGCEGSDSVVAGFVVAGSVVAGSVVMPVVMPGSVVEGSVLPVYTETHETIALEQYWSLLFVISDAWNNNTRTTPVNVLWSMKHKTLTLEQH